mmetsp:Transcript_135405/g.234842  ORF Transcript_135405/g.234842 Transcript_135405/m.234842 type:complete len:372 (+) Transcript_135405:797-1912(+)
MRGPVPLPLVAEEPMDGHGPAHTPRAGPCEPHHVAHQRAVDRAARPLGRHLQRPLVHAAGVGPVPRGLSRWRGLGPPAGRVPGRGRPVLGPRGAGPRGGPGGAVPRRGMGLRRPAPRGRGRPLRALQLDAALHPPHPVLEPLRRPHWVPPGGQAAPGPVARRPARRVGPLQAVCRLGPNAAHFGPGLAVGVGARSRSPRQQLSRGHYGPGHGAGLPRRRTGPRHPLRLGTPPQLPRRLRLRPVRRVRPLQPPPEPVRPDGGVPQHLRPAAVGRPLGRGGLRPAEDQSRADAQTGRSAPPPPDHALGSRPAVDHPHCQPHTAPDTNRAPHRDPHAHRVSKPHRHPRPHLYTHHLGHPYTAPHDHPDSPPHQD